MVDSFRIAQDVKTLKILCYDMDGELIESPVPPLTLKTAYQEGKFLFELKTDKSGDTYWRKSRLNVR